MLRDATGHVFLGFDEGDVAFRPTYKYDRGEPGKRGAGGAHVTWDRGGWRAGGWRVE
jgi:hypothetical protein